MKPEQLYQHLKELAEKLDVTVAEQSFKQAGIHVKSGFCVVKKKKMYIVDRNINQNQKNQVLAEFLATQPIEDMFVAPAVRDFIERFK